MADEATQTLRTKAVQILDAAAQAFVRRVGEPQGVRPRPPPRCCRSERERASRGATSNKCSRVPSSPRRDFGGACRAGFAPGLVEANRYARPPNRDRIRIRQTPGDDAEQSGPLGKPNPRGWPQGRLHHAEPAGRAMGWRLGPGQAVGRSRPTTSVRCPNAAMNTQSGDRRREPVRRGPRDRPPGAPGRGPGRAAVRQAGAPFDASVPRPGTGPCGRWPEDPRRARLAPGEEQDQPDGDPDDHDAGRRGLRYRGLKPDRRDRDDQRDPQQDVQHEGRTDALNRQREADVGPGHAGATGGGNRGRSRRGAARDQMAQRERRQVDAKRRPQVRRGVLREDGARQLGVATGAHRRARRRSAQAGGSPLPTFDSEPGCRGAAADQVLDDEEERQDRQRPLQWVDGALGPLRRPGGYVALAAHGLATLPREGRTHALPVRVSSPTTGAGSRSRRRSAGPGSSRRGP